MKKTSLALLAAVVALAGCSEAAPVAEQTAAPAPLETSAPSPLPLASPIQLTGTVNNRGVKDFTTVGNNFAVEFTMGDFYFTPTFVKALPGSNVTFSLLNESATTHTFTSALNALNVEVAPGGKFEGQLKLPDTGVVEFYCKFHVDTGMKGAFFFQDGEGAPVDGAATSAAAGGSISGTGSFTGAGTPTGSKPANVAPAKKLASATAARTITPAPPAPPAPKPVTPINRPGDLVIEDLVIGEPAKGATSQTIPAPKLPAPKLPPPKTSTTTATNNSNSVKGADAKSGTVGGTGATGIPGVKSAEGADGTGGTKKIVTNTKTHTSTVSTDNN